MPNSRPGPSRRGLLSSTAVAAAATMGGVPLLSACGGEGSRGEEGRVSEDELRSILPTYRASDAAIEPDNASEHGSSPGYTRWTRQEELGVSVPAPTPRGDTGGPRSATRPGGGLHILNSLGHEPP